MMVPILKGQTDETIDKLLMRLMKGRKGILPDAEEIWEVPLPIIEAPKPEPRQQTMAYGQGQGESRL